MAMSFEKVRECVKSLKEKWAAEGLCDFTPEMAVICDIELSGALEGMEGFLPATTLPFSNLSNSPLHRVQGRLVAGWLQERPLLLLLGRIHPHDGFTLSEAGFPSRMCRLLGCRRLLVCTNAVCLSSSSAAVMNSPLENCDTELVIIKDHLNFSGLGGLSALAGQNDPRFGPRYFPLVEAYNPAWRESTKALANGLGFPVREGVSAEVGAPHEVTSIEKNMLAKMGATVMGKGSVAEVLTGVHAGLEVQVLAFVSSRPREVEEGKKISRLLAAVCGFAKLCDHM